MPQKRTKPNTIKKTHAFNADEQKKQQTKKTIKLHNPRQRGAGTADICSKDINQLLMGNPPVSIGGEDISAIWKDTKRSARDLDKYRSKGWGNYPGTPPLPDCVIL